MKLTVPSVLLEGIGELAHNLPAGSTALNKLEQAGTQGVTHPSMS